MGNIYAQLSLDERTMIHTQLERGINATAIAVGLNCSASRLSRELRQNGCTRPKTRRSPGCPPVAGGYRADAAHTRVHACTVTPRVERRLRPGTALWDQVIHYLKSGYSRAAHGGHWLVAVWPCQTPSTCARRRPTRADT
jgi:IS30 family transposase